MIGSVLFAYGPFQQIFKCLELCIQLPSNDKEWSDLGLNYISGSGNSKILHFSRDK